MSKFGQTQRAIYGQIHVALTTRTSAFGVRPSLTVAPMTATTFMISIREMKEKLPTLS